MTKPLILRAADRLATLWKNGLGVTREIAVHPPSAGLGDFDWRLSMATVDAGGPFSTFPGIDRKLAVLQGRLSLRVDSQAPIGLGPESPLLAFAGDVPVEAEVLDGPVTDLNLMTRRGRVQGAMERLVIDRPTTVEASAPTIILVRTSGVRLSSDADRWSLGTNDAALFDPAFTQAIQIEPSAPSTLFVIRLTTP
jgi:hypothetical protein